MAQPPAGWPRSLRTPRHIIRLMVEMAAPTPKDTICDPASGTCGYLVAAGEYLREKHPKLFQDELARAHFHHGMFHGCDLDNTIPWFSAKDFKQNDCLTRLITWPPK